MKFVVDDKIPYIQGVLEPYGMVVYLPGAAITNHIVKDADVLITRTRTLCNKELLSGSTVKLITTATIGYDHIDTEYCKSAGISWTNAPGCNSKSVEQYIASALIILAQRKGFELKGKTIGVVGVGQVGTKVARLCRLLGMNVLLNDPPRQRIEISAPFSSLNEIVEKSDIITLHVPLNLYGDDRTFHLADSSFFNSLQRKPLLINSCRGEVADTVALKKALRTGQISGLVIDCWENEPSIDLELLSLADLATPHIAGYSRDGKANGTAMCVQAISRLFNLGINNWQADQIELPEQTTIEINHSNQSDEEVFTKAVLHAYDIRRDDSAFRENPALFEKLRGNYPLRREFTSYTVNSANIGITTRKILSELGFKTSD